MQFKVAQIVGIERKKYWLESLQFHQVKNTPKIKENIVSM